MTRTLRLVMGAALVACGPSPPPSVAVVEQPATSASAPASASASAPARPLTREEQLVAQAEQMQLAILGAAGGGHIDAGGASSVDFSGAVRTPPPQGKTTPPAAGPRADAVIRQVTTSADVPDAPRVVAGLRPRFRACYQVGLNSDPTMTGQLTIGAEIAPSGDVTSANAISNVGLTPGVAACVASVVKRATFSPPSTGASAKLSVVTTFVVSK